MLHAADLVPDGLDVVQVQHVDVERRRVADDLDRHRARCERRDVGQEDQQAVGDPLLHRHGDDAGADPVAGRDDLAGQRRVGHHQLAEEVGDEPHDRHGPEHVVRLRPAGRQQGEEAQGDEHPARDVGDAQATPHGHPRHDEPQRQQVPLHGPSTVLTYRTGSSRSAAARSL